MTTILVLTIAPGAAASNIGQQVPAQRLTSKCIGVNDKNGQPTIAWRGGHVGDWGQYNPNLWAPHGKMYMCYWLFRIGGMNTDGELYAVEMQTVWADGGGVFNSDSAIASHYVSSDTPAKDSEFGATGSHTSRDSCDKSISVGLGIGPFSVSTPISMCKSETLSSMFGGKVAHWGIQRAALVRQIQTVFYQKVAHRAKPDFRIWFTVPYYSYKVTYDMYGDPWWEVTSRKWKDYIYSVAVP